MSKVLKQYLSKYNWIVLVILFSVHCSLFILPAGAQTGSWRAYMSYYEPQQIVKANNKLFVRASNDLYNYNMSDHSITTYDKVNTLNDTYITHIAWNASAKRLIIVYQNSNIDLIDLNDNVTNISALYTKSMTQDKTVNNIYINGNFAYLATGFGVVKINMQRAEISESYILNHNVSDITIINNKIYVKIVDEYFDYSIFPTNDEAIKSDGNITVNPYINTNSNTITLVLCSNLTDNLIDPHNWSTPESVPSDVFNVDNNDWNENIELVKTLQPGGPKHNFFGFMTFANGQLYTSTSIAGGSFRTGGIQVKNNDDWQIYQDTDLTAITGLTNYSYVTSLAIDPKNPNHVFAGARNGLYEFLDGQLVKQYNNSNSPIGLYLGNAPEFQMITGAVCDNEGNVWCLNSQSTTASLLKMNIESGEWTSYDLPDLMKLTISSKTHSLGCMTNMIVDSQGYIWFINDHYDLDSFYCFDPKSSQLVSIYKGFANQDGTTYNDYRPHCMVETADGDLWIGTKFGPFVLEYANRYTSNAALTQVKVPRNDGSNYADYLLSGVNISCMAIDGGGRKWIGTNGFGAYLISADNMTQLEYFTMDNSPLLSDNIESIAINNETGEVFFGTDKGLCSYMSDATEASIEMVKDNVYAYPNPVVPGYDGLITIVGLSLDADVKILSASGQLVAQGRSNGGSFTWNGCDRSGHRVASGIYMVAAATSEGKKGTVCKIAIIK